MASGIKLGAVQKLQTGENYFGIDTHLFETATQPDYVIAFLAHVENWQAILSSEAGAVWQACKIAPYPEDFSRRIEES